MEERFDARTVNATIMQVIGFETLEPDAGEGTAS